MTAESGTTNAHVLGEHFVSGPYERIFVTPENEKAFVRAYLTGTGGRLEYAFTIEEYFNLRVIGITSPLGNASIVSIGDEQLAKLPDYIQQTRQLYVVDDIDATYRVAESYDVPQLQPRTPNIMGAQGRLLLAPGYIIELAETTNRDLFDPDPSALGYR